MTPFIGGWKKPHDTKGLALEKDYQVTGQPYPQVADVRNNDSAIRDQEQEGSCTAFSSTAAMENVEAKLGLPRVILSPQYPYCKVRQVEKTWPQDAGASILDIIKCEMKFGVPPESDWPYSDQDYNKLPPLKAILDARKDMVTALYVMKQALDVMCDIIASGFPFVAGIDWFSNYPTDNSTKGLLPPPNGDYQGGHALEWVCYNLKATEQSSPTVQGAVIPPMCFGFKNSWGLSFGLNGYGFIPIDSLLNPNWAMEFIQIVREQIKAS
jgi:C1A family cysteine protease